MHNASTIRRSSTRRRNLLRAAPFVLPFLLLFIVIYLIPTVYSVVQSFFGAHREGLGLGGAQLGFVGFDNYVRAFTDPAFIASLGRVFFIGIIQVPLMLVIALGLALLLDSRVAIAKRFFRLGYFVPYGLPGVIAALVWSFLYAPTLSPVVQFAAGLGIDISFVSDAMLPFSIANIMTWAWTGYNMVLLYSALQSIPNEVMEAAAIDGCSGWRAALRIKVPLIRPALLLTLVFSIIGTAQLFNEPVTMRSIAPNLPSDYTPIMMAVKWLSANDFNYAATLSVILGAIVCLLSVFVFRASAKRVD
ncbi:carbohydrate ABC transporter permease [Compostimonas suwonensis]|uniref:Multiple sugar transport system permease protein n=1 Tax=Compostimonas suwonensis TaxID=1048394 RepID=A0A2M9BCX2_9MICO|nr:sugar ABC transporter permease [Compostimonas suwonensis]PJJ55793.1 multiple sugar transport system permease protein [Compostimonas suwonensis]